MPDDAQQLTPPLTVSSLAEKFDCSRATMSRWLRSGELEGVERVGSRWMIPWRLMPAIAPEREGPVEKAA